MFIINCLRHDKNFYLIGYSRGELFTDYINDYKYRNISKKVNYSDKLLMSQMLNKQLNSTYKTPEILAIFNNTDDFLTFDFSKLIQEEYVIKSNHGSGMNRFFLKGECPTISDIKKILTWFSYKSHLSSRESHYNQITKKVFIERLLETDIRDFKVYCFNGNAKIIQVDSSRFKDHRRDLFDLEWNKLNFKYIYRNSDDIINKPENLIEIVEESKKIAPLFEFVRIDWYSISGNLFLGELTFHPEGGLGPFESKNQDRNFLAFLKNG